MHNNNYERLSAVTQAVNSKLSLPEVLQEVVNAIAHEVAGVDLVGYFEYVGDRNFVGKYANKVPTVQIPGTDIKKDFPITSLEIDLDMDPFAREIVDRLEPVMILDAANDPRPDPEKIAAFDIKTCYGLPVQYEGEIFGLVFLQDQGKPMDLSFNVRSLVDSFVAMAGVASKNARLFEDQGRLIKVTRDLAASLSTQQVLDTCFKNITEVSGIDTCGIHLLSEQDSGHVLVPTYLTRNSQISHASWLETHQKLGSLDLNSDALFFESVNERKLIAIEHVEKDPRPDQVKCASFGIQSLMVIPLAVAGEVLGVVALPSIGKKFTYTDRIQRLCNSIAESTAIALKNAITAEKLDALVQERTVELTEANAKLQDIVTELKGLDKLKSDFIATVSHELRTPISIVTQVLDLFDQGILGSLTDHQHTYIEKAQTHVKKLSDQVEDLLDFSKIASGSFHISTEVINYTKLLDEIIGSVATIAAKKQQKIVKDYDKVSVIADQKRLGQIILNLLSNSYKFTPDRGTITVKVRKQGEFVVTTVTDTGIGIEAEALGRIFDRFFQVDNSSTRSYNGTGLGLSITKSLVEMHGGTISVESTPGVSTSFTFTLPVA